MSTQITISSTYLWTLSMACIRSGFPASSARALSCHVPFLVWNLRAFPPASMSAALFVIWCFLSWFGFCVVVF